MKSIDFFKGAICQEDISLLGQFCAEVTTTLMIKPFLKHPYTKRSFRVRVRVRDRDRSLFVERGGWCNMKYGLLDFC